MVEVEIRSPAYNEESQQLEWHEIAHVRAGEGIVDVYGDNSCVPSDPVIDVATGRSVHPEHDPETWARNLPHAYRSGDLVAVVVCDDGSQRVERDDQARPEPAIPDPPAPTLDERRAESVAR